ncbi:hypothetical protein VNO77_04394 [Canavalia gladiata]|uniref:Uncharacterized protein n=1 Tax=Canavalia gladiata TaxID=3824 RepID=A0AAN9R911_CANGL
MCEIYAFCFLESPVRTESRLLVHNRMMIVSCRLISDIQFRVVIDRAVEQVFESPQKDNVNAGSDTLDEQENERVHLQGHGIDSVTTITDVDQFERLLTWKISYSPGSERPFGHTNEQFASSFNFSSPVYSPGSSPQKPRHEDGKPNMSAEILHLVDSAIMGKPEGMEKLKNIVRGVEIFVSGEEMESTSFLIVDSLLATMGGVECFEKDDDNPPSVMLNSRDKNGKGTTCHNSGMHKKHRDVLNGWSVRSAVENSRKFFTVDVGINGQIRWDGTPLCHCIQYLARHSLSVSDLNRGFQVVTRTLTTIWAPRLILVMEKSISEKESSGPACTFEFDGESFGLLGPVAAAIAVAASAKSGKSSAMLTVAAASALAGEGQMGHGNPKSCPELKQACTSSKSFIRAA